MTFEEIDERYHEAALDDDQGEGWDDPSELSEEDEFEDEEFEEAEDEKL